MAAVRMMKPRPRGGFSSLNICRSLRRWSSSSILRDTPVRLSQGTRTR
jgi:hypothetical protein